MLLMEKYMTCVSHLFLRIHYLLCRSLLLFYCLKIKHSKSKLRHAAKRTLAKAVINYTTKETKEN